MAVRVAFHSANVSKTTKLYCVFVINKMYAAINTPNIGSGGFKATTNKTVFAFAVLGKANVSPRTVPMAIDKKEELFCIPHIHGEFIQSQLEDDRLRSFGISHCTTAACSNKFQSL